MKIQRARILENQRRLQTALGAENITSRVFSFDRAVADKYMAGILYWHGQEGIVEIRAGRKDIDWSGEKYKDQGGDTSPGSFFFLCHLAEAYLQNRDGKYAAAARDYITDWMRAHPAQGDWAPADYDSTLAIPCRVDMWATTLTACLEAESFDDAFLQRMFASIAAQFAYLARHIGGGNWGVAQGDSFLRAGILLDGVYPAAAAWRLKGARVLNDLYRRDILPDGAHIERTPDYHSWMTDVYQRCWKLGRAMPELGLAMTAERVARMYDYMLAMTRPDGMENPIEDSHAHLRGGPAADPFAVRRAFRTAAGLPDELPSPLQFFPYAGQACLRERWDKDATYLTFDATVWGGAHCHLSRNAVQLFAHGQPLITDPGRLSYNPAAPIMSYARSTRAHSTVNINGWNQIFANPTTRFRSTEGYALADSLYESGYWSGVYTWYFSDGFGEGRWGEHHRSLLWIRGRCAVILDNVTYSIMAKTDFVESNWTLSPGSAEILPEGDAASTTREDANVLMLFPLKPASAKLSIHEGENDPLRGWALRTWAPHSYQPAPQICLRMDNLSPKPTTFNMATVLIPYAGNERPAVTAVVVDPGMWGVGKLVLRWPGGEVDEIWYRRRLQQALYDCGDFDTDGTLVHFQKNGKAQVVRGMVADGTYLAPFSPESRTNKEMLVFGA